MQGVGHLSDVHPNHQSWNLGIHQDRSPRYRCTPQVDDLSGLDETEKETLSLINAFLALRMENVEEMTEQQMITSELH